VSGGRIGSRAAGGLRTRFHPKSRIGQGLVAVAPWLNAVLLVGFFLVLNGNFVLDPGITVNAPSVPFRDGMHSRLVMVVFSVARVTPGERTEIAFFDDDRYLVGQEGQMAKLREALAEQVRRHPDQGLVITADRHVQHGTVVAMMNLAMEMGVRRVNLSAEPF